MWLHSLKVAQLLCSAACLHTNQSRSYLNHLVFELKVFVVALFCVLVKHVFVTLLYYSGVCYTTHTGDSGSIICYQNVVCCSLY